MDKYNLPKGYSLFDGILKARELSKDLIKFIGTSMDKFGDTYSASIGIKQKVILTQDPDFITHILKGNHRNYQRSKLFSERATKFYGNGFLFIDGEPWRKQRRLLQPNFHRQKIGLLFENIQKTIQQFLANMPIGDNLDIYPLMHQLSFDILMQSLFKMNISLETQQELKEVYLHLENFTYQDAQKPLSKLFYPITGKEKKAIAQSNRLRSILQTIVKERKETQKEFGDLLDMLIHSRYEDTNETMSNDKIVDELIVLIQAGHDTTATTLAWIIYLLAKHPEKRKELSATIKEFPIKESFQNKYLRAVIHEAMRLYPTSWLVERTAIQDDQFGDYIYPKGTMIIGFYYGLHRNEKLWENPLSFQPERFIDNPKLENSKQFYPFGGGPRKCIGIHFALAEMVLFITAFLGKFEVVSTGETPNIQPMATLRPDKVMVNIRKKLD